jgi:hypothetical protein
MRKKMAGVLLATGLTMGLGPLATAVHADPTTTTNTTDPVLCFVAAQSIITEALTEYRAGTITVAHLRTILVGTASFLGDCLTP